MLFHTHIAFGILLALIFFPYLGSPWLFAPVILIAGILPDIDTPTSTVGKQWVLRPMQWCVKHRGFFHSLIAAVLFSLAIFGWSRNASVAFFIGYVGHLFTDSLTKEGIPILWPLDIRAAGPIRTGGIREALFLMLIILLVIIVSYAKFF
jgi:inner membrane protein